MADEQDGAAVLLWQYPDQDLQVEAVRRDGDARGLFSWWETAVRSSPT